MRKVLIISFILCSVLAVSQSLERTVIGAGGTDLSTVNGSLDFTLGELVVQSKVGATQQLHQGFQQESIQLRLKLAAVVFLQGPLVTTGTILMDDGLRKNNMLPTTSPYSDKQQCDTGVLAVTGKDAIVDWVWITLRDKSDSDTVVTGQSALLQADGDIVSTDGVSAVGFKITSGDYYIAVNHRNHLAIRSQNTVALTPVATSVNLGDSPSAVYEGAAALVSMGNGIYAMIAGDCDGNGQIQNTDATTVKQSIGVAGYSDADVDMNGQVQNSDVNTVLQVNMGKGEQFK